jgi:hypothetical protein
VEEDRGIRTPVQLTVLHLISAGSQNRQIPDQLDPEQAPCGNQRECMEQEGKEFEGCKAPVELRVEVMEGPGFPDPGATHYPAINFTASL